MPSELIIATSEAWPPYSYVSDGEVRGILVDFWREYGRQNDIDIKFLISDWAGTLANVKNHKAHIHAGLFYTKERDTYLDFSTDLPLSLATRLFVSRDLTIGGLSDIGPIQVGMTAGGFAESFIKQKFPKVRIKTYPNSQQTIEAAKRGEILAFAADYPAAMFYLHRFDLPENFHVADTLYTNHLQSAVASKNANLLPSIDQGLNNYPASEAERITQRWLQSSVVTPKWIWPTVLGILGTIIFASVVLYTVILRRQVRAKTIELEIASQTDALTGIPNRRHLENILTQELYRHCRYKTPLSIILLDIDYFKQVNDQYGHAVGDAVLIGFAETIRKNIRESDTVGRWGGEEFLIICPETYNSQATILAKKLRQVIELTSYSKAGHITSSFGVVEAKSEEAFDALFSRADRTLYKAKDAGRNHVCTDMQAP